jgi:tetratricopeptide (TPR) repeat protein
LVKARIAINQKSYNEAESLLERNLTLYSQQPFQAGTSLLSPSLMLLARVYSETGRTKKAANKFNEAIEIIEGDDKYLESEKLRVKFDDERRELYDSAINFEFDSGSIEGAWIYLQKYQSKLFHEFLAQFNPKIEQTRAKLDRIGVQQRIPKDTQIIEYALMKNRLLIWLLTDKLFTVRSVDISRAALEDKVQIVLQKLRVGGEADVLLADLGKLLIDPIANVLDPNRTRSSTSWPSIRCSETARKRAVPDSGVSDCRQPESHPFPHN